MRQSGGGGGVGDDDYDDDDDDEVGWDGMGWGENLNGVYIYIIKYSRYLTYLPNVATYPHATEMPKCNTQQEQLQKPIHPSNGIEVFIAYACIILLWTPFPLA